MGCSPFKCNSIFSIFLYSLYNTHKNAESKERKVFQSNKYITSHCILIFIYVHFSTVRKYGIFLSPRITHISWMAVVDFTVHSTIAYGIFVGPCNTDMAMVQAVIEKIYLISAFDGSGMRWASNELEVPDVYSIYYV